MKAETKTGEIIPLPKECDCYMHNEPHWVYMDRLDRERNTEVLRRPKSGMQTYLGCMGMAIEESARLREKERNFQRLGIVRLIPEESDVLTDKQKLTIERRYESIAAENQQKIEAREAKAREVSETPEQRRRRENDRKAEIEYAARKSL